MGFIINFEYEQLTNQKKKFESKFVEKTTFKTQFTFVCYC